MANATYSTGLYVNYGSAALYLDIYETTDPANNRSLIRGVLTLAHSGSGSPFNNNASSASMTIGGSSWGWSGGYNLPGNSSMTLIDQSVWVGHNANGEGSVGVSGSFSGNGNFPIGSGSTSGTYTMVNFDRKPDAPSSVSASRSGTSLTVYAGSANSPAGTPTYYVQYSQNGGGWTAQNVMSGQQFTYTNLAKGSTYRFRVWATNSDGTGPASESIGYLIPTEPLAPASLTVSAPVGRSVTVTAGTAPNGGATVTKYFAQYSADNGSTWSTPQAMTGQSYTYSLLDGGITYLFRAYAVNEMGNGAVAMSSPVFVPSSGKRWDGTDWIATNISRRWDGTSWVNLTVAKKWNGTEWVNLG